MELFVHLFQDKAVTFKIISAEQFFRAVFDNDHCPQQSMFREIMAQTALEAFLYFKAFSLVITNYKRKIWSEAL